MDKDVARKAVVVGDGGWGTALAMLLDAHRCETGLWSHDEEYATWMRRERTNPRFLPGFRIPPAIRISADMEALVQGADLVISAVPTAYLRAVWAQHGPLLPPDVAVVSVSKGLEEGSHLRPTQILRELTGDRPIAVLSGPNIAREIAEGKPAASVVAGGDASTVRKVQQTLSGERFRVYSNPDPLGVELGGVLKNVIAIAAGMCDGLSLGVNAKAALCSRGVIEMARLGERLGGERRTLFGISGLGDLLVTCYSPLSRNRTFGERLGRGERVDDIVASMNQVAEGVKTSAPVHDLMLEHELALPISEQVYLVVHEGKSPRDVTSSLMLRGVKDEAEDLF